VARDYTVAEFAESVCQVCVSMYTRDVDNIMDVQFEKSIVSSNGGELSFQVCL